jgi:hypothetical protein
MIGLYSGIKRSKSEGFEDSVYGFDHQNSTIIEKGVCHVRRVSTSRREQLPAALNMVRKNTTLTAVKRNKMR